MNRERDIHEFIDAKLSPMAQEERHELCYGVSGDARTPAEPRGPAESCDA